MATPTKTTFDQAIFTSVRTPMGEGYRIIACSKGLRPNEKQIITRYSPSHSGLCAVDAPTASGPLGIQGLAFYPLSDDRLCVAISVNAGAEHTGRGGHRVYTHQVVLDAADFQAWDYNPMNIARAMVAEGLAKPQLKAPAVLAKLELSTTGHCEALRSVKTPDAIKTGLGIRAMTCLLDKQHAVLDMAGDWIEAVEAVLVGVPGQLRASLSISAGLHYSASRVHSLMVLADANGATQKRIAGQSILLLSSGQTCDPVGGNSAWAEFVGRQWQSDNMHALATRTSREFFDAGPDGREIVGGLYNLMDGVGSSTPGDLIAGVSTYLGPDTIAREPELVQEFIHLTKAELSRRIGECALSDADACWFDLLELWKRSAKSASFALPLMEKILQGLVHETPIAAINRAIDLAGAYGCPNAAQPRQQAIDRVLSCFADCVPSLCEDDLSKLAPIVERLKLVSAGSPAIERIQGCVDALNSAQPASSASE